MYLQERLSVHPKFRKKEFGWLHRRIIPSYTKGTAKKLRIFAF